MEKEGVNVAMDGVNVTVSPTKVVTHFLKSGLDGDEQKIKEKNELLAMMCVKKQEKELCISLNNKCPECNGLGFDPGIFERIEEKCPSCKGTGFKLAECSRCDGTGKIGDIPCYTCKGRGTYLYKKTNKYPGKKCKECQGTGKKFKLVQTSEPIPCNHCKGAGVIKKLDNYVIERQVGLEMMKMITN